MSDIRDVQDAICQKIVAAIYPNGSNAASATGFDVIVYPGWPSQSNLDDDLIAGKTHVNVFPRAEERNTTRYPDIELVTKDPAPTLTAVISGQSVVLGGVVSVPQNVGLLVGSGAYVYAVKASDTLATIATALVGLLQVDYPAAHSNGAIILLPDAALIKAARVGASGTVAREIRRQEKRVQVTVWSNTPDNRTAVARLIDAALSSIRFLDLADGFAARIIYQSSLDDDAKQKAKLYRRDFLFSVEYPTTISEAAPAVVVEQLNITGGQDPDRAPVVKTIYQ